MNIATARALADQLNLAASDAELNDRTEIDLTATLAAADDAARAELQAAINAATA